MILPLSLLRVGLLARAKLCPAARNRLFLLLLLQEDERIDLVRHRVLAGQRVDDLLAANQTGHDAGAHHERQHEPVHAVPAGRPPADCRPRIAVVQEVERQELTDQRVLNREQQGRPCHRRRDHTGRVTLVAMSAAIPSPFEAPVNGSEEGENLLSIRLVFVAHATRGTYHGTVADLDRLKEVEHQLGCLA